MCKRLLKIMEKVGASAILCILILYDFPPKKILKRNQVINRKISPKHNLTKYLKVTIYSSYR